MQLTCPECAARFGLPAALNDEEARETLARAFEHGPLGRRLVDYVALFRPEKRGLAWRRASRLMDELLDDVDAGVLRRRGRTYETPHACWRAAIDAVLARRDEGALRLPLKDHGYLREVVARLAESGGYEDVRRPEPATVAARQEAQAEADAARWKERNDLEARAMHLDVWRHGMTAQELKDAIQAAEGGADDDDPEQALAAARAHLRTKVEAAQGQARPLLLFRARQLGIRHEGMTDLELNDEINAAEDRVLEKYAREARAMELGVWRPEMSDVEIEEALRTAEAGVNEEVGGNC